MWVAGGKIGGAEFDAFIGDGVNSSTNLTITARHIWYISIGKWASDYWARCSAKYHDYWTNYKW